MGVGAFFGHRSGSFDTNNAKLYGVELDSVSGRIAQQLYQKAKIQICGYEKADLPDSFFDLAIGNVPFGQYQVTDRQYDKLHFQIHDYFLAKTVDKLRVGGIMALITTSGTMDKKSEGVRRYLAARCDLIGAVRLPNNAFTAQAGTTVTSDILFLQKRGRVLEQDAPWIHVGETADGIPLNRYFIDHPEMICGEMQMVSGPYGQRPTCASLENGTSLEGQLDTALANLQAEYTLADDREDAQEESDTLDADPDTRNFSYVVKDDTVYYRENSKMRAVKASTTALTRIKALVPLRDTCRELIRAQLDNLPDETIAALQAQLTAQYDSYHDTYGLINSRGTASAFREDSGYFLLCSLEDIDSEGHYRGKTDMFTKRTIRPAQVVDHVDTADEALVLSLTEKARVDLAYMAQVTGKSQDEIIRDLTGVIFRDPEQDEPVYLPADEYLSGNFDAWASTFGESVTAIELAPEGNGYRSKTRFAKFYNLPELMNMFKQCADIQTADMLKLPVPEITGGKPTIVKLPPSELQRQMVAALGERAEAVRNRLVAPNEDNMLRITNDGRKLALDQRLMNPLLPDDPDSKANACVERVFTIWERTKAHRSTQMIFCDLSTPRADGFDVYNDIRDKLVARGIPKEEVQFIHDADTEAKKAELFGKVRSGAVRVLMGSTQKMGAGTNVQTRLCALHHLDCPWRPADIAQRNGRMVRQGNMNKEVSIFIYITEATFDAYSYQLVENKQKFISQIMTSKSPARSCEDLDEAALSYAEVKALAAGNPMIKEKMDLDIQVARLRTLKAAYNSQHYRLEDAVTGIFLREIRGTECRIQAFEKDMQTAKDSQSYDKDGKPVFSIELDGTSYDKREDAGKALLGLVGAAVRADHHVLVGHYAGFEVTVAYVPLSKVFVAHLSYALGYLCDEHNYYITPSYEDEGWYVEKTTFASDTAAYNGNYHIHKDNGLAESQDQVAKGNVEISKVVSSSGQSNGLELEGAGFTFYLVSDLSKVEQFDQTRTGSYTLQSILDTYINKEYDNEHPKWDFSGETQAIAKTYEVNADEMAAYNKTLTTAGDNKNGKGDGWQPTGRANEYQLAEIFSNDSGNIRVQGLSYGTYLVVETTTPHDLFQAEPFLVSIDSEQDNNPWGAMATPKDSVMKASDSYQKFTVLDEEIEVYLKITKLDTETGKSVLLPNTAFQIYWLDDNGNYRLENGKPKLVTMTDTVNGHLAKNVDTFYTNEEGILTLPEKLPLGKYRIVETVGPDGFYNEWADSGNYYVDFDISTDRIAEPCHEDAGNSGEQL